MNIAWIKLPAVWTLIFFSLSLFFSFIIPLLWFLSDRPSNSCGHSVCSHSVVVCQENWHLPILTAGENGHGNSHSFWWVQLGREGSMRKLTCFLSLCFFFFFNLSQALYSFLPSPFSPKSCGHPSHCLCGTQYFNAALRLLLNWVSTIA